MDKDISDSVREVRKIKNRIKKCIQEGLDATDLNDQYRDRKKQLCYKIRKSKRETWRTFCDSVETANEASRLRKILAKENSPPGFIKKENITWAETGEEILDILMNAHFPDSSPVDEETTINANYNGSNGGRYNNIITEEKVKWAINSFDMYKSPGPDGIFPAMLHHVIDELMP